MYNYIIIILHIHIIVSFVQVHIYINIKYKYLFETQCLIMCLCNSAASIFLPLMLSDLRKVQLSAHPSVNIRSSPAHAKYQSKIWRSK